MYGIPPVSDYKPPEHGRAVQKNTGTKTEYRAWGALKSVLNNRGFGIKAKKCLYMKE